MLSVPRLLFVFCLLAVFSLGAWANISPIASGPDLATSTSDSLVHEFQTATEPSWGPFSGSRHSHAVIRIADVPAFSDDSDTENLTDEIFVDMSRPARPAVQWRTPVVLDLQPATVPEPLSLLLFGSGLLPIAWWRRRLR